VISKIISWSIKSSISAFRIISVIILCVLDTVCHFGIYAYIKLYNIINLAFCFDNIYYYSSLQICFWERCATASGQAGAMIAQVRCFQSSEHSSRIPRSRNWSFTFHVREELKAPRKNGLAQVPGQSEFLGKSREGFASKDGRTSGMAAVSTTKSLHLPSFVVNISYKTFSEVLVALKCYSLEFYYSESY